MSIHAHYITCFLAVCATVLIPCRYCHVIFTYFLAGRFDFQESSFEVELNLTHRSVCFSIATIDNNLFEMTETFIVTATVLQAPFQVILYPNMSTVTILDNDCELQWVSKHYTSRDGLP